MRTLIYIFILSTILPAQEDKFTFQQLTDSDGLSQSTIFQTIQDQRGFLWFATIDGLNRYDGYEFKVYSHDPADSFSLSDNFISSLYEDTDGVIWVGTVNGFINKFDRKSQRFIRYRINDYFRTEQEPDAAYYDYPLAFSRNQVNTITTIAEDNGGFIWFGTWGNGVIRFDKETENGVHIYHNNELDYELNSNRITDILLDINGDIWISTFGGGINKLISNSTKLTTDNIQFNFINYSKKQNLLQGLTDDNVITLIEDKSGNLWAGTYSGGLNKLDVQNKNLPPDKAAFKYYTTKRGCNNCICSNTVMAIVQDHEGYLWLGTFGGGIDRFNIESEKFYHFDKSAGSNSIPDNEILSLFVDRSGILWVGSHLGEGITSVQKNTSKFYLINSKSNSTVKLNDDVVWSVFKDSKENLWIGTYRGGLNKINLKLNSIDYFSKSITKKNSMDKNHIRAITEDNFGNLWIGTYSSGVSRFNPEKNIIDNFINDPSDPNSISANQVLDILIESDSVVWLATYGGGLNKLMFKKNTSVDSPTIQVYKNVPSTPTSVSDNRLYNLFIDSRNNFWVGTYGGGLNKFDKKTESFKIYRSDENDKSTISSDKILVIHEDSNNTLWIGTSGGGLCKFDHESETFIRIEKNTGLVSSVIYGILEDGDGNLWLSSDDGIIKFEPNENKFTQFGLEDGLQSLEFSGGAYFKDESGMMYFGGINGLNYFHPDSIITNKFIPPVVISNITIFDETFYGETEELILSHDQNFISFEFSALDFSNPPRNKYSFILEGLQSQWQSADATRRVANYLNLPPGKYTFRVRGTNSDGFWNETGTSISIIINPPFWQTWWFLTLVILSIAFFIYYLSTIRVKNELMIERVKSKIASDLHDNVGAGLTEISILSEVVAQRLNSGTNELKNISETARQLVDNMSDIVWVVNPQRDSLYDLIIKLKDSYNEFLNSLGVSFQVKNIDKTNDVHLPMDYKQNLLLMFKEAINNAIKHSKCTKIILEANIENNNIILNLSDDGIGFKNIGLTFGNGMKNMENRAKKLNGKIIWNSTPGYGTKVEFVGKIGKVFKLKSYLKI